jgi:hypothetical protein
MVLSLFYVNSWLHTAVPFALTIHPIPKLGEGNELHPGDEMKEYGKPMRFSLVKDFASAPWF